jgi:hypothetical protein
MTSLMVTNVKIPTNSEAVWATGNSGRWRDFIQLLELICRNSKVIVSLFIVS